MSTSNRLARAVDRARELARQLEGKDGADVESASDTDRRVHELTVVEGRAVMLLRVLQSFYIALGGFAMATLVSLIGAVLAPFNAGIVITALEISAVGAGIVAVSAMVRGSIMLVRETQIAVGVMHERATRVRDFIKRG